MAAKILSHRELDPILDGFAADPDAFEARCLELIAELDRDGMLLEISDPTTWRRALPEGARRPAAGLLEQLRGDIERIETIGREPEAQLARRVEFARLRLGVAREAAGHEGELLDGIGQMSVQWFDLGRETPRKNKADERALRRAAELHALRTELVERNLYLVLINVERYTHSSINRSDLIQEGSAALFRAVDGFDWRRGLLFRTYAVHWLNQAFRNYLYNCSSTVRVPVYLQKALKQINQAQIRLGDTNASAEQIAEITDLTENLVKSALGAARSAYSLDADFGGDDGDGNRLRDLLTEEQDEDGPYSTRLEDVTLGEGLEQALAKLSDREQFVVRKRFGLGYEREHTLAEVADDLKVSVERVRQIQVRALSKLDTPTLRRELDPFVN
ncbi:sigma-70 family RNA polymerase sigma factor [Engelhardtia mirabilis]|uniref:RNA polymerase sigma factor RpoD n=1 Tax=Engelhardtia mirabilis TaxID=2528011 RepID=A0A518BRJ0_9BACT|nr:RNA polymerase sigma factor RpoD [Planctomycetes bacterium Pla133]QDV03920.1 RNA polymerase sigma factor RpoD [Planctomycetes bacterium Pla86]